MVLFMTTPTVVSIYVGALGVHTSESVENKLEVMMDGIKGDRHRGVTTLSGSQEKHIVPKGTFVTNLRQVTIVSHEELIKIAQALGVERIYPEDLSANILIQGIPDFTKLPPGYFMEFKAKPSESAAVLRLMGENRPCIVAATNVAKTHIEKPNIMRDFVKVALGLRGQVAIVYKPGIIRLNSEVILNSHQPKALDIN